MNFNVKRQPEPRIDEEVIAYCYIYRDKDEKNKCLLTHRQLHIIKNGRHSAFDLQDITKINFSQKKMLLPLVAGGIMASLGIMALIRGFLNPWYMLTGSLAGISLFYLGWTGTTTFSIHTQVKEHPFFIRSVSKNLSAFLYYSKQHLAFGESPEKSFFFFPINRETWENKKTAIKRDGLQGTDAPLMLYTYEQMHAYRQQHPDETALFITINPKKGIGDIRFEVPEGQEELHPFAHSRIAPEALILFGENPETPPYPNK